MRINANDPPDAAVQELERRLRTKVRPALLLLTPEGDVLHVQYARLYPAYHFNAVEMSGWSEVLWTSKDVLALVERVETQRTQDDARLAALAAQDTPEALVEHARMLAARARPARARALLERAIEAKPSVEAHELLAELHVTGGRAADARAAFRALLALAPSDPRADDWRLRAARLLVLQVDRAEAATRKGSQDEEYAEAMRVVRQLAKNAEDPAIRIRSQLTLGRVWHAVGDHEALGRQLAGIEAPGEGDVACPERWTPAMLIELADLELMVGGRFAQRATAHAWLVTRCFPDSVEAQRVKHGMLDGNIRITEPR